MKRLPVLLFMLAALLLVLSPAQAADSVGKTPVRTVTKTDVQAQRSGADGTTVGQTSVNNTAQGGAGIGGDFVLPAIVQSSLPTYSTNGNLVGLTVDASGRLYVVTDATVTTSTNVKQIGGTNVDVNTGNASAGTQRVVLATNQPTVPVSQGAPTGAATNRSTPTSIASSGTTALTCVGSLTTSQPVKVYSVTITGAAMARCTIRYNNNTAMTNFGDVITTPTSPTVQWNCPAGFCAVTAGASGTQAIEANCTNFDVAAQDFGCAVSYCSAASGC